MLLSTTAHLTSLLSKWNVCWNPVVSWRIYLHTTNCNLSSGYSINCCLHFYHIIKCSLHEPEINGRIDRGRIAITKPNSILWHRDVTPKTKTHIFHAVVKSTNTYAAETGCLEAKTVAKLNSTEMDFWRRSA